MSNIFLNTTLLLEQLEMVLTPALDMDHCLVEMSEVETIEKDGKTHITVSPERTLTLCLGADELEELGHLFLSASNALKRAEKRV